MSITPRFLLRITGLPLGALDALRFDETLAGLDRQRALAAERARIVSPLCEALHEAVPRVAPEVRGSILRLKRSVYNDHAPRNPDVEAAMPWLAPATQALLAAWLESQQRAVEHAAGLERTFQQELVTRRMTLQTLCGNENLRQGIQLSSQDVLYDLERYLTLQPATQVLRKRDRHIELTLLNYLFRMATKPTPFGDFTSLAVGTWRAQGPALELTSLRDVQGRKARRVRITRAFVLTIERALARHPDLRPHLFLSLNNTLVLGARSADYFARGLDGTTDGFGNESFRRLPVTPVLAHVVGLLSEHEPVRYGELVDALAAAAGRPIPREELTAYFERLIEAQVLHLDAGIPDQTDGYIDALARVTAAMPGAAAAHVTSMLGRLAGLERGLERADYARRSACIREIEDIFAQITKLLDMPVINLSNARTLVYEDVFLPDAAPSLGQQALQPVLDDLALWQQILPLFDDAVLDRLTLLRFFERVHGETVASVPLFEFYRAYKQAGAEIERLRQHLTAPDSEDSAVMGLRRAQDEFHRHVERCLQRTAAREPVVLDRSWLRGFVAALPPLVEHAGSLAHYGQLGISGDGRHQLVWNGAGLGFGKQFSRFCGFEAEASADAAPDASGPGLDAGLAAALRAAWSRPGQAVAATDLTAALGINLNVHPRLLPYELTYPGSKRDPRNGSTPLDLRALVVRRSSRKDALELFAPALGQPLTIVPLGFLFPALGPPLYRFLAAFSPGRGIQLQYWTLFDLWHGTAGSDRIRSYPRLQLGDVIIDRETWKIPRTSLPRLHAGESGLARLREICRWRDALDLPWQFFLRERCITSGLHGLPLQRTQLQELLKDAYQAKKRKPFYVDLRSYFSIMLLDTYLKSVESTVTVHEFSPGHADVRHFVDGHAAEFVVELNQIPGPE